MNVVHLLPFWKQSTPVTEGNQLRRGFSIPRFTMWQRGNVVSEPSSCPPGVPVLPSTGRITRIAFNSTLQSDRTSFHCPQSVKSSKDPFRIHSESDGTISFTGSVETFRSGAPDESLPMGSWQRPRQMAAVAQSLFLMIWHLFAAGDGKEKKRKKKKKKRNQIIWNKSEREGKERNKQKQLNKGNQSTNKRRNRHLKAFEKRAANTRNTGSFVAVCIVRSRAS